MPIQGPRMKLRVLAEIEANLKPLCPRELRLPMRKGPVRVGVIAALGFATSSECAARSGLGALLERLDLSAAEWPAAFRHPVAPLEVDFIQRHVANVPSRYTRTS
jgi:hypothetical protein